MRWLIPALTLTLASCTVSRAPQTNADDLIPASEVAGFAEVVRAVQPVAARQCRQRIQSTQGTKATNCEFLVFVDPNRWAAPNAFQSLDEQGRPVLTFTASLITSTRNPDELAFILGHEAAHHIARHLDRQEINAATGADAFGELAKLTGGNAADVAYAQRLRAEVGARSYSKEFELEADELGTLITYRAGYNPLIGMQFFATLPDPGDRFLGTHPPNAKRIDVVRRTSARLGVPE
jgi:predicted Zn-dependent protease